MLYHRADTWDRNAEHEIYFNQQKIFYNNLSIKPKESVTLRLHSSYILRNPNEKKLWLDHDKSVYVDNGNSPIEELIKKSRIVVFSYDSTGMLEILSKIFLSLHFGKISWIVFVSQQKYITRVYIRQKLFIFLLNQLQNK